MEEFENEVFLDRFDSSIKAAHVHHPAAGYFKMKQTLADPVVFRGEERGENRHNVGKRK